MQIKKILVPIDFSPCSINALKIAASMAKEYGAEIEIVHAVHVPAHPHADVIAAGALVQPILDDYEANVEEKFQNLKSEITALSEVTFNTRKFISVPTDAIYSCVEKDNIDLIIMGTKGNHDSLEKLIGSVSSDVIRSSTVPVLMIPGNIKDLNIQSIGFAADLKRIKEPKKLETLLKLAKWLKATVKIFHISEASDESHLIDQAREKIQLLDSLESVEKSYIWMTEQNIYDGIFEFINSHKVDMLAMYPRHHGFWDRLIHGSTTKHVAVNIQIPLLTIHE